MIAALWSRFAGYIAALGALLALIVGAFLKGRSDQKAKTELKDLRDANDIRRDGAAARAGAAVSPDRLREDDGFKRK